ncbi:MAG: hypothetical protein RI910_473, partial [Verrucomicrobiota bacterium]
VSAFAQDKATLDLLVKKGLITAEERAKTLDEAAKARAASGLNKIFAKEDNAKRLTFAGRVQTQWESIGYSETTASGTTNFNDVNNVLMRRAYLGFKADIGEGISAELVYNFADNSDAVATGSSTSTSTSSGGVTTTTTTTTTVSPTVRAGAFDKVIFTHDSSLGKFDLGYQKVQWGLEENTSSSKLYTVERSLVTRYWAEAENGRRLGFGARHVGLHYSNKLALDAAGTLEYGAALVNAKQGYNATGINDFGTYVNVAYTYKITDTNRHTAGVNWGQTADVSASNALTSFGGSIDKMSGFNPYFKSQFDKLVIQGEMQTTNVDQKNAAAANIGGAERDPTGYNLIVAYKITDAIEAVARYSYIDTDGRGIRVGDGFRDAQTGATYNKANSYYVGVNYYFVDHNAKICFGYEKGQLKDSISYQADGSFLVNSVNKADADVFRLQAQVLF